MEQEWIEPRRSFGPLAAVAIAFGFAVALAVGLAIGHPHASTLVPAVGLAGLAVIAFALMRPFPAFLMVAGSSIFFMVFDLPSGRGINLFDLLLPCLLIATMLGGARAEARMADRDIRDPRRAELLRARRRLGHAVVGFYAVAVLSIVHMVLVGRSGTAVANSTLGLLRAVQGLMLFPLGLWLLRSESRIHTAMRALIVAGLLISVANTVALAMGLVGRAGLTWFVNSSEAVIGGPNETAPAMLLLGVLLLVRQTRHRQVRNLLALLVFAAMMVASTSRSGLLASAAFVVMVMPRARWSWMLLAGLVVLAAVPLIPHDYWTRMSRTLAMEKGTFEAYTSLIRVYCWKTAFSVFLHNPFLGVGYVSFSTVSGDYGELRLIGAPAENFYLETASGMGIPGLIAMVFVLVRLFQLGRVVQRTAPAGSLAQRMAPYHVPFLVSLLIVNLTGSALVAMVALGQLSMWMVMLVRAGDLALEAEEA